MVYYLEVSLLWIFSAEVRCLYLRFISIKVIWFILLLSSVSNRSVGGLDRLGGRQWLDSVEGLSRPAPLSLFTLSPPWKRIGILWLLGGLGKRWSRGRGAWLGLPYFLLSAYRSNLPTKTSQASRQFDFGSRAWPARLLDELVSFACSHLKVGLVYWAREPFFGLTEKRSSARFFIRQIHNIFVKFYK